MESAEIEEAIFETIYLVFAVFCGVYLLVKSKGRLDYILLGIAILVLGGGDAFHLIPRMIGLNTTGLENYKVASWIFLNKGRSNEEDFKRLDEFLDKVVKPS